MEPLPPGAEDVDPPAPGVETGASVGGHGFPQFYHEQQYPVGRDFYGQPTEYGFEGYSLSHQDPSTAPQAADYTYSQYYHTSDLNAPQSTTPQGVQEPTPPPPPPPAPPPAPPPPPPPVHTSTSQTLTATATPGHAKAGGHGDSALVQLQQRVQEFLKKGGEGNVEDSGKNEAEEKGRPAAAATVKHLKGAKLIIPANVKPKHLQQQQQQMIPPTDKVPLARQTKPGTSKKGKGNPEGLNLFLPEPRTVPEMPEPSMQLLQARKQILERQKAAAPSPQPASPESSYGKGGDEGMKVGSGWHRRSYRRKRGASVGEQTHSKSENSGGSSRSRSRSRSKHRKRGYARCSVSKSPSEIRTKRKSGRRKERKSGRRRRDSRSRSPSRSRHPRRHRGRSRSPVKVLKRWSPEPSVSPDQGMQESFRERSNPIPSPEKKCVEGKVKSDLANGASLGASGKPDLDISSLVGDISQIDRITTLDRNFSFLGQSRDGPPKAEQQTVSDFADGGDDLKDRRDAKSIKAESDRSQSLPRHDSDEESDYEQHMKKSKKKRKHKKKHKKHKKKRSIDVKSESLDDSDREDGADATGSPGNRDRSNARRKHPSYFQHDDRVADQGNWMDRISKRMRSDGWTSGDETQERSEFGRTYMDCQDDRIRDFARGSKWLRQGRKIGSRGYDRSGRGRDGSPHRSDRGRSPDRGRFESRSRTRLRSRCSRSRSGSRSRSMGGRGRGSPGADGCETDGISADVARAAEAARLAALQGPSACAPVQLSRHARRIYVGGLPVGVTEVEITQFFNHLMTIVGGCTLPGLPILSCFMNPEKRFAFMEFRSVEETSNAMAFDGVMFKGETLKIRRPHDYNGPAAALLGPSEPNSNLNLAALGLVNTVVADGPNKLFVGGLPSYLGEDQVRSLLQIFGSLKAFNLITDREAGTSRGYGFCEYEDTKTTDFALEGLSAISVGGKTLTVRRTQQQLRGDDKSDENFALSGVTVVRLASMVDAQDIVDQERYDEVLADISHEVVKYGKVHEVVIPRTEGGDGKPAQEGHVYLEMGDAVSAKRLMDALNGRMFMNRKVEAGIFDKTAYMDVKQG